MNGLIALVVTLATLAALPARADDGLQEARLPVDRRLDQSVTVARGRVYLGELLDELSRQSGLPLRVDDQKGAVSGIDVTVFVKRRPLREVMTALVELFSYRGEQWKWEAAGPATSGGYLLLHQQAPHAASAANRKRLLERFASDVRDFHAVAQIPPGERQAAAERFPRLFPGGRIDTGKLELFSRVEKAGLDRVLQGLSAFVDANALSDGGKAALNFGLQGLPPEEVAGGVRFDITWEPPMIGPVLWARNKQGIGGNLVGGPVWDKAWLESEAEAWRDRHDPEADAYYRKRYAGEGGVPLTAPTLAAWLKAAAERQDLNVIADPVVPRAGQRTSAAWLGTTPRETVLALQFHQQTTVRKSGEIYLLRDATAKLSPRLHLVPWKQIKALRLAADRNGGTLPVPQLAELATLTEWQLGGLQEEFPAASPPLLTPWREILVFHGKLDDRARRLLESADGVPFVETGLAARKELLAGEDRQGVRGLKKLGVDAAQIRLRLRTQPFKGTPRSRQGTAEVEGIDLTWEVAFDGKSGHRSVLRQLPRVPLQPE